MPITYRKIYLAESEEELLTMTRPEATLNLNDKQITFCEAYAKNNNIRIAAVKAGYTKKSAAFVGYRLRQNEDVCRYLAWLKLRISKDCHVGAMEIIDQYIRIAFADVTDFVKIENNRVRLVNADEIDGQLITEVKEGRDGISIKLADKMAALARLERYFEIMPKDWKEKIEEKKLELMKERLELEKRKLGEGEEAEDDGFMEALKESAAEVWEDEDSD